MKIKSLLIGMLACTALVGCSDDVIEGGSLENQGDKVYGHLTVSFSANGNSSRSTADDANNKGDQDGNQEHSGHINVGTAAENAVNDALVVIMNKQQGKDGWAGYFEVAKDDGQTISEGKYFEAVGSNDSKFYTTGEPIVIPTGDYEVLVVANPYSVTLGAEGFSWPTGEEAVKEVTDYNNVKLLYDAITTGKYTNTTSITAPTKNYAGNILSVENGALKGIMMVNKSSSSVTVKSENTESNPANANVEIERVASKITFRPSSNIQDGEDYTYVVEVPVVSKVTALTASVDVNGDGQEETVNLGNYNNENVYVLLSGTDGSIQLYKRNKNANGTYDEVKYEADNNIIYEYNKSENKENWYVKLEKYALVNLSKSVYHARHIADLSTDKWEQTGALPFGQLDGTNFLWTPNWPDINEVTFNTDGTFAIGDQTDTWFYNTLKDVSDKSKTLTSSTTTFEYFQPFESTAYGAGESDVTTDNSVGNQVQHKDELASIGNLLGYCLENTTDIEHQMHGLSTGISLQAKIYKKDDSGNEVSVNMYRYAGNLFESVDDILNAYGVTGANAATAPEQLKELLDENGALKTDVARDDLLAAGITPYNSNICYYYTTEIKHFDNGKPEELGNMEFAIMRNNIYSLAVTDIKIIGDPWVDPVPNIPDEHPKRNAVVVEAKIMPWIVRYHDIEF